MDMALYDPSDGFFGSGRLRSATDGDFLTSPEVSHLFGETLACFVEAEYQRLSAPDDFSVCDAGAGSGSLLGPLVEALPIAPSTYALEVSPAARQALARRIPGVEVAQRLDDLPTPFVGVIVANELLDNLPMALAVKAGHEWAEMWVVTDGDELAFERRPARGDVRDWLHRYAGPVPDGGIVEVQLAATAWVSEAISRLDAGSILVIDYGDLADNLGHRRAEGTLRTYRGHHLGPHPLTEPGSTDITADLNFTAILGAAAGDAEVDFVRQDEFLRRWGLDERRAALRAEELDLARAGDAMARLVVRTRLTEADTLLHPRGLGDFRVMVARR